MSSVKVSALSAKTSPSGSEELLINDGGTSKKITIANLPDNDTTYSTATATTEGLVKIEDNTAQTVAANTVTATASRTYGVQLNSSDQAVVNVPWTDTDTGITDVVDDATPQLGGNLDFQTHKATSFTSTGIDDNATSTAITIDASENVGIGTTNPAVPLDVRGGVSSNWAAILESTNATGWGTKILGGADGGDYSLLVKNYADTSLFEVRADGNVTVNTGNLVIGTSGKGIDFSAVSDGSRSVSSNLLDDYEEGTWTPTLNGTALATNSGWYFKIGDQVTMGFGNRSGAASVAVNAVALLSGFPFSFGYDQASSVSLIANDADDSYKALAMPGRLSINSCSFTNRSAAATATGDPWSFLASHTVV